MKNQMFNRLLQPQNKIFGSYALSLPCLALSSLLLVSCSQEEAQLSLLVDSFNSQIDTKNKELEQVRASELQLRAQLAEISGRMQEMEAQLSEVKSTPAATPEAVAVAVWDKLRPNLEEISKNLAAPPATSSQPASVTPQPDPPLSNPRVDDRPTRENTQKYDFSFP